MRQIYSSGVLPLQPKPKSGWRESRGFVWRKAYIFEIRTGRHASVEKKIVIQLHSSQTRKGADHASTEIVLNRNEAEHLVAGILAAMHDEEGAST